MAHQLHDAESTTASEQIGSIVGHLLHRIQSGLDTGLLTASGPCAEYMQANSAAHMNDGIVYGLRVETRQLMMTNEDFIDLTMVLNIKGDIFDNRQGCYGDVVQGKTSGMMAMYIGGAAALYAGHATRPRGLRIRISQHNSEAHRAAHPNSAHYKAMAEEDNESDI